MLTFVHHADVTFCQPNLDLPSLVHEYALDGVLYRALVNDNLFNTGTPMFIDQKHETCDEASRMYRCHTFFPCFHLFG
jgi:hypothetical protein